MTDTLGIIGGLLFFIRLPFQLFLMAQTNKEFAWRALSSPQAPERFALFLFFLEDAPKGLKWLKICVNVMYAVSILFIIIFLIGENTK